MADKPRMIMGVPESERLERFAGSFVETRNPERAYRYAFVIDKGQTSHWVAMEARRLLNRRDVMLRVQELRDEAAAATMMSAKELIQDWADIANADPNELVSVIAENCRYCHGEGNAYQWVDEAEYALTVADAIKRKQTPPTCAGGYGFNTRARPSPDCPSCFGDGHKRVQLHDTRHLSERGRKLYKGAKQKGDGSIEVLMHDQQAARESLAKIFGAFKDGIDVTPVRETPAIDRAATPEAAQQTYLRLAVNNDRR